MELAHKGVLNRLIWNGRSERRFFYGEQGVYYAGLQDGDFLLKDHSCTVAPVFEQELAICVNAKSEHNLGVRWLTISKMSTTELSWNDAVRFVEKKGGNLPSLDALTLLLPRQKLLNVSLGMIGRKDLFISDYAIGDYWYVECQEDLSKINGKRKVVVVETIPQYSVCGQCIGRCDKFFTCNEVITVHQEAVGLYWVLQRIGDWYYALDDRCFFNMYNRSDRCCNGSIYMKDDKTLIIENPSSEIYFIGEIRFVKTYKNIYQKNGFGVYTRRGYEEGRWAIID